MYCCIILVVNTDVTCTFVKLSFTEITPHSNSPCAPLISSDHIIHTHLVVPTGYVQLTRPATFIVDLDCLQHPDDIIYVMHKQGILDGRSRIGMIFSWLL